jgi:hypothetical protein
MDIEDRFWKKVDKKSDDECWLWLGWTTKRYGRFYVAGRKRVATHIALELVGRVVPEGMLVCHTCDTPECVNPAHLFIGTHRDNAHDMKLKGRSTANRGNPAAAKLTEDNVHEIRRLYRTERWTQKRIAARFNVTPQQIKNIVNGWSWSHL